MDEAARLRILVKAQADELDWRRAQDQELARLRVICYDLTRRINDLEVAFRREATHAFPRLPPTDRFGNGG